jgi:lambda family phage portal protein
MKIVDKIKAAGRILFGYDAIQNTRNRKNRGLEPIRSEEIELNSHDRDRLISTLMNFKRNNPVVKSISRLRKTDVIGSGINAQPMTSDEGFNTRLVDLWASWCEYPEVTKTMNMPLVQKEIIDATLFQGDIGVLLSRSGDLQLIEGNRIGNQWSAQSYTETNPDKQGVIVNKVGRPIRYKVGDRINGTLMNVRNVPARDMILYFKRVRATQWRGIPELAPVVNALQDVSEYEDIEMISAKVSASLSAVVKKENSAQFEIADRMDDSEQDTIGRLQKFEPGNFHYLEAGESIETIASNGRPNVDGIDWCIYRIRQVGSAVGIPVEMILSLIGQTSFSAAQGLVLQYQGAIEEEQRCLIQVLSRIYKWKVRRWLADGAITLPSGQTLNSFDPYKVRWQQPAFRWINRSSQVESDAKYLQMGAMSLDDVASQFGDSAEAVMRRKAQNIVTAKMLADEFGLDNWTELFNFYNVNASANFTDIINPENLDQ